MTDRDYIFTTKSRKTGLAIATIILTVLTAIFGIKNAGAFFEKLSEYGLKPALTEYVPILILAGAAVLFSLFFLFSSWRASRISRKKMIKLAEQAEEAKAKGIEQVVFDRGGYIYHGRVSELAAGAREGGLNF